MFEISGYSVLHSCMVIWETEYFLTSNLLETGKFNHTQHANRYNAMLPKVASLVSPSILRSPSNHPATPPTPSTRVRRDDQDPVESLERDGPLEVKHCFSCCLHTLVARALRVHGWMGGICYFNSVGSFFCSCHTHVYL